MLAVALPSLSPLIVGLALSAIGEHAAEWHGILAFIALCSASLYFALVAVKILVRLSRIAKIDHYISNVGAVKSALENYLASVDAAIDGLAPVIGNSNMVIRPAADIDAEIEGYKGIADTFSYSEASVLAWFVNAAYWVSTVLLGTAFVAFTGPMLSEAVCSTFGISLYGFVFVVYAVLAASILIFAQVILHGLVERFSFGTYMASLVSGPLAVPILWALGWVIYVLFWVLIAALIIGAIIGILYILFSR